MNRRYATHYLEDTLTTLTTLAAEFTELQRRLTAWTKDGYPSSSGQPGGSTTLSDPTAQAVIAPDHVALDRDKLHADLIRIHNLAAGIDAIRRTYMNPINEQHQAELKKLARCANPTCDMLAVKAGRCTACYQFHRRTGEERVA